MRGDDQDARIHGAGAYATRREAVTLGLAALSLLLLLTRGPTVADAALHLDTAAGIVTRGSTALSFDPGELVVTTEPLAGGLVYMDEAGVVRSSQPPGWALVALPGVAIGCAVAAWTDQPPLASVLDPLFVDEGRSFRGLLGPLARDPRAIGFSLVGPLSGSATLVFVWMTLAALGVPRSRRLWIAAALFVSPLGVYAGTCWTQSFTAAALAFATWRTVVGGRGVAAGVALALAVLVRPDHLLLLPAYVLARPRRALPLLWPSALAMVGLWVHGLPQPAGGWDLEGWPVGAAGLLVSPLSGLLVYAPFVSMAPWGIAGAPRRVRALLWIPLAQLTLYAGWFDWDATLALGPRFLVPSLPVLAIFAGLARSDRALAALTVLGLVLNLPAHLLAHARVPESHAFFRPAFLDAWRTLLGATDEALGPGIDCASTHVSAYAWMALGAAALGMAWSSTRPRARRAARGADAPRH